MSDLLARLIAKHSSKPRIDLDALIAKFRGGGELSAAERQILDLSEPDAAGISQRWRERRDFYRSTDEQFEPSEWRVDAMVGKSGGSASAWEAGQRFIITNHYAASFGQMRVMVGLFRASDGLLCGIAAYGNVKRDQALRYGAVELDAIMELNRFVLLDEVPGNAETWFLARATKLASEIHASRGHRLDVLLSYSDPVPRRSVTGSLTMPGHIGNIYQANNAIYVGRSSPKTLHLAASGVAPDPRMISKIHTLDDNSPDKGATAAARRLEQEYGAPPRGRAESHRSWVRRALASAAFRRVAHPGNLTYLWTLGDKRLKAELLDKFPEQLPYPKTPRQLYLNLTRKYERAWTRGEAPLIAQLATELGTTWDKLTTEEQHGLLDPPAASGVCSIRGSPNRAIWTLDQVMSDLVCRE